MFADDTNTLISNINYEELNLNFKSVPSQISKQFQANQLILNIQKTSLVKFAPTKSSLNPLHLSQAGQKLVELNNIKFLGLQLDNQLEWKMHINYLLNKLSVICVIMRRPVHTLNIKTLTVIHFAHFHCLKKYGTIFWGNSTTTYNVFIFKKKKILQTTLGIGPVCNCKGWFVKLNILPVPSVYTYFFK